MFNKIIKFSIQNKLIIGLLTFALIAIGIYSIKQIPIDAVPDITNNQVQIVTSSTSLAPQEVEQFITYPVEIAMANIPETEEIRSISRYGLSVVTVVFKDHVNILKARQFVAEQIKEAEEEIPSEFGKPTMMPITTGLGEIYQYVLTVDEEHKYQYSLTDLRTFQDWIVKRQLAGTKGIIEISTFGGKLKQYEVAVNPSSLRNYNITITDVFDALGKNNQNTGGSYIEKQNNAYYIRALGLVNNIRDIEKIVVTNKNEKPILVRDIAQVRIGSAPRFGAMTMDGKGEVVGGITLMFKGENSSKVIENVKEKIETIKKSLPEGVHIYPYLDRSSLVDRAISTVSTNLIEGGLIVIFVLVLLLGNLRAGIIVASVIPLSLLFAITLMNIFGVSANLMSLGAIDFGLVVDGSIIVVEAVLHRLYSGKNRKLSQSEMDEAVFNSSSKIRKSAAFGEIIILIVYLPILALVGIEGKMFGPMAQTVSFAILGALILSLTYVPMMSALFLKKNIVIKETLADKIINLCKKVYFPALKFVLNHSKKSVAIVLGIFIISVIGFNRMGGEFIPTLEEGDLALQASIQPGSSLSESIKYTNKVEKLILNKFPEVKHVVSKIGAPEIPTDPMGIENFDIMLVMKPKSEWTSASNREELSHLIKEELEAIVGLAIEVTQPIQLRFNELISGSKADIAIKLFGENNDILAQKASEIPSLIGKIQGVGDLSVEQTKGLPQLLIKYDRNKLARYGISIADVNTIIRAAYAGETASTVFENERKFDLVVRLNEQSKKDVVLERLFIKSNTGASIPISEVASVSYEDGPNQISRENAQRRVTIGVNARNRDVESLVSEIQTVLDEKLNLAPGYYLRYGGQFENLNKAKDRLSIAVPVALLLIIFLLYITFGSVKYALLIFTAVPLSAIGGVAALYLRNMPFSISAGIGFIALFGVAVLNGIVLISYFNSLRKEYPDWTIRQIIEEGALVRLRPVILTAAVASLGFLPMAISTSAGAEVQKPLATVVIGGLISATILTLLILPALYQLMESKMFQKKKLNKNFIAILFIIGASTFVKAQESPKQLTQEEAIEIAIKNSVELKNAIAKVSIVKAAKTEAFQFDATKFAYQSVGIAENIDENEFTIQQNFGSIISQIQQKNVAKAQLSFEEKNLLIQTKEIEKNVLTLYHNWANQYKKLELIEAQILIVEKVKKISDSFFNEGEIGGLERDLSLLQTVNYQAQRIEIFNNLQFLEAELKNVLVIQESIKPKTDSYKRKKTPSLEKELNPEFEELLAAKVSVANKNVKASKSMFVPQLTAKYINRKNTNATGFSGYGIGVNIPLDFWSKNAKVKQDKIKKDQIITETNASKNNLKNKVSQLKQQLIYMQKQLDEMDPNIVQKSEKFKSKIQTAYKEGEIDAFEFLQSFTTYSQIMLNYLDVINNYNQTVIEYSFYVEE
ncbi:CusA/CzcA family heavy metal efflux RND transporter [Aureivirga marina]|uniref:CusA/CzcA family heavy metal efflux RND transporter n=1 Tax=Aureivirga marina TaxID=1182451 RepID=UPI0018CBE9B3|nr:CusA/CzcA family heavy metal efflux RND transporter [Aureivirga marina]